MGNTQATSLLLAGTTVHPHTSGEYLNLTHDYSYILGSSPHKWGIQQGTIGELERTRFIPTQVGNTSSGSHSHSVNRFIPTQVGNTVHYACATILLTVHPHTSGEYETIFFQRSEQFGSSPHKWGIPLIHNLEPRWHRFIPTQVGNTFYDCVMVESRSVHPHTSGEYGAWRATDEPDDGSSPHKWGILFHRRISST